MKKSELRSGMFIQAGDGCVFLVVNTEFGKFGVFHGANCNLDENYDEDLKRINIPQRTKDHHNFKQDNWDIKKVYILCKKMSYIINTDFGSSFKRSVERQEWEGMPEEMKQKIYDEKVKVTQEGDIQVYRFIEPTSDDINEGI